MTNKYNAAKDDKQNTTPSLRRQKLKKRRSKLMWITTYLNKKRKKGVER
jgi:hypothetical protein